MSFDGIVTLVVNLGVSAAAAVALIWFLYTLISKTLPGMLALFQAELEAQRVAYRKALARERRYRHEERAALLDAMKETHAARMAEHFKILDRLDFGFKNVIDELGELRASSDQRKPKGNGT